MIDTMAEWLRRQTRTYNPSSVFFGSAGSNPAGVVFDMSFESTVFFPRACPLSAEIS